MGLDVTQLLTNVIYCGDCRDVLKQFPSEQIDMIYLDPPFFTQKIYENFWIKDKTSKLTFSDAEWERLRGSIDPAIMKEYDAMEERWKGGKKGIYVYIAYMRERLEKCWGVLKSTGTIYLHCDWHARDYLKVMMDEIFGYDNFRNDIVWNHQILGAAHGKVFPKAHECLLRYSKSDTFTFNENDPDLRMPFSDSIINALKKDEKGYFYTRGRMTRQATADEIARGAGTKTYVNLEKGKLMGDVWSDLKFYQPPGKERLGYPTQKPEALLERVIRASSNEGDIVLDPFCGCGTAVAVAHRLRRRWIGIDISRTACDVIAERLRRMNFAPKIIGGETPEDLNKLSPNDFARFLIVEKLGGIVNPKKSADMGIDGWTDFMMVPVQVKQWGHSVGRPEIDKFLTAVMRAKKQRGIIIAESFSKDCYEEVARIKREMMVDIQLLPVEQIMGWK